MPDVVREMTREEKIYDRASNELLKCLNDIHNGQGDVKTKCRMAEVLTGVVCNLYAVAKDSREGGCGAPEERPTALDSTQPAVDPVNAPVNTSKTPPG